VRGAPPALGLFVTAVKFAGGKWMEKAKRRDRSQTQKQFFVSPGTRMVFLCVRSSRRSAKKKM